MAIRVPEAARRLGVDPATLRRAIREGQVPARKIGKSWYLSPRVLERWLAGDDSVGSEL